jgi:hypothetical protein
MAQFGHSARLVSTSFFRERPQTEVAFSSRTRQVNGMTDQPDDAAENHAPESKLPGDLLALLSEYGEQKRFRIRGFVIRKDKDNQPWWMAVVRGNSIMLEACLRESGVRTAFAGSPTHCRIRLATWNEVEAYLDSD